MVYDEEVKSLKAYSLAVQGEGGCFITGTQG